jgi:hypothetical protein
MNITTETTNEFMNKAEEIIRRMDGNVNVESFLKELYQYANERSERYVPARYELVAEHETGVDKNFLDFNCMLLAIVLFSWAIRYRKVKSDEGQCHMHIKDCNDTRMLHSCIYDQWIDVVEEALNALRAGRPPQVS